MSRNRVFEEACSSYRPKAAAATRPTRLTPAMLALALAVEMLTPDQRDELRRRYERHRVLVPGVRMDSPASEN